MRARGIKPAFFKNEDLAALPPHARLLFIGLWCLADRLGRLEDRVQRIKAEVFPYENIDVGGLLTQLSGAGFIVRYEVDGGRFIEVLAFLKHQYPHVKEALSTIPAPIQAPTFTGLAPDSHHTSTVQTPCEHPLTPDSGLLTPDSGLLTPSPPIPEEPPYPLGKGDDVSSSRRKSKRASKKPPRAMPPGWTPALEARFDALWQLYPNKAGKDAARHAYAGALSDGVADKAIEAGILRHLTCQQWVRDDGEFIPFGSTWFDNARWNDEPTQPAGSTYAKGGNFAIGF